MSYETIKYELEDNKKYIKMVIDQDEAANNALKESKKKMKI